MTAELSTSDTDSKVDGNTRVIPDATVHLPSISQTADTNNSHELATTSEEKGHSEREPTTSTSTHVAYNEAASRSDPSIGTSQPSISLTGHDEKKREEDKSSFRAATLTIPVKPQRRRKSSKGTTKGKGPTLITTEKPRSIASTDDSKPPAKKRQKISLLERIASICTPCLHKTHEIDIEEGASHRVEPAKHEDTTEKVATKEVETTTEHGTREPSATATSKRSSLLGCYSGLTSASSRGPSSSS